MLMRSVFQITHVDLLVKDYSSYAISRRDRCFFAPQVLSDGAAAASVLEALSAEYARLFPAP